MMATSCRHAVRLSRTPRPAAGVLLLRRVHLESTTTATTTAPPKYKSREDLPGPSLARTAYLLFAKGYASRSHALQTEFKRLYGPIWRSRFGPYDLVNVASPELVAQVLRQEGRYPVRAQLPHWLEYRDLRGTAYGMHLNTGEEWNRIRRELNPLLLKPPASVSYAPVVNQVVGDLLQRLERLRLRSADGGGAVADVQTELYKFGFEAVCAVVFETRLGCLQEDVPERTLRFLSAVHTMWTLSETIVFLPRWTRAFLPLWQRFVQAWDDIHDTAMTLIDTKTRDLAERTRRGEPAGDGGFLSHLLSSDALPNDEICTSVVELMLGGVDTTSNTLCWVLYHLSRDPRVQDRLHKEVVSVCPGQTEPDVDCLAHMPYLKAVVKETLRMYPVIPGNGRLALENDVILDDYWFPKGTQFHLCHYVTSRDEAGFPQSGRFVPERWLRGPQDPRDPRCPQRDPQGPAGFTHHPYSYIPFGVGLRACLGKRLAELEMYFTLTRLMQHYQILPTEDEEVEIRTRTLMIPERPINLRFLPRA